MAEDGANNSSLQQGLDDAFAVDVTLADVSSRDEIVVLTAVINWILSLAAVLALLALVVGGVMYIVSFGNDQRTQSAKKIIISAIIGLVIIGVSFLVIEMINSFLITGSP